MATKTQFDQAAERLLGKTKYEKLLSSGFTRPDFCREIAQYAFIQGLIPAPTHSDDVALIQRVANRLWIGDGITGLDD